jgi:hypothetical protein
MIQRDITGTPRKLLSLTMRDEGGTLRELKSLYMRDKSNVLRKIFSSLSATATPAYVTTTVRSNITATAQTPSTSLTIEGGTGPYTVEWAQTTGDDGWSISNSSGLSTAFSISLAPSADETGTFEATITDAAGNTTTVSVTAHARNIGGTA